MTQREVRVSALLTDGIFGRSVASAVMSSPALGRGAAALREAQAGLLAETGAFSPQISLGLRPKNQAGFGSSVFVSVSQIIYDGGASVSRKTAAHARVLGGVAGQLDAGSQAALTAVETWAAVARARALVIVADASLAALETTTAQIEERTGAGLGSSADALTAQSRLANDRVAVVAARSEVARAEAVFAEVFGQPPMSNLNLPAIAPKAPSGGTEGNPTLRRAEAAVLAAQAEHTATLAGRMPTLSLAVSATPGSDAIVGFASERLLSPSNGHTARIAIAKARIGARQAELDATQRELESRLRILSAEVQAVGERLTSTRNATEANRANLVVAREQFHAGRRSLIELQDAEREALASERQKILAEYEQAVLGYAVLAATGDILDVFGVTLPVTTTLKEASK
ncbi:MAG: TolC family protein [Sulfitobacter sp.]|nr:TolC family protein [Sulfitobacter sp.]